MLYYADLNQPDVTSFWDHIIIIQDFLFPWILF